MRGKNTLYNAIIPSSLPDDGRKGQRNTYLEQRDDAMACRFYFHAHLCRLRYDDCLLNLSREFFLSHNVIVQRLQDRTDLIKRLVKEGATAQELRKEYGFFRW